MRLSRELRTWLTIVGAALVATAVVTGLVMPAAFETTAPDKWEWVGVAGLVAMDPQRITDAIVRVLKAWRWGNGRVDDAEV